MNPHESEENQPPQDPAQPGPQSQEAHDGLPQQYPTEQPQYDPGQAFVDPSMGQPDPNQQYVDPNQQYADPNQQYVDPNQATHDPGQAYVERPASPYDPNAAVPGPPPPITSGPPVPDPGPPEPAAAAPRRSPGRKMATSKRGGRRPATGRAGSRYQKPKPSYGGGITVMDVFLFLVACAMVTVIVFVVLPKDLSGVDGYPADPLVEKKDVRNLLAEGQKIMVDRKEKLEIAEKDVNKYLNFRLNGEQTGIMSSLVKFKGAYIDFTPGLAEIIVERELFGLPITMTSRVRPEKFQRQVVYRNAGWSIGKIDFNSRNIKPIIDMFIRMRIACKEEFEVLKQMNGVEFADNKVILDPVL